MEHHTCCLNCTTDLNAHDNFCHNCGQKVMAHRRITMHHISHEVIHAFTHADKGFFFLIVELALRPARTVKEFLSGKHKKYFNPFSFFFIVLGFYVLSNTFFKPFNSRADFAESRNGQVVKYPPNIKTAKQKAKYDKIKARVDSAMNFMNVHTNVVLCISTPFIAFVMFLLYRRQLYYAEHLVVMTFVNSFLNLLSIFIFTPLTYFIGGKASSAIVAVMLLSHVVYMFIVYFGVLNLQPTFKGYLKCFGSVVLAIGIWILISASAISAYIFYGVFYFK